VLVYVPDNAAPYSQNDLKGVEAFIARVSDRNLRQSEIEDIMMDPTLPCPEAVGDSLSRFLTSGPYAEGPSEDHGEGFREGNDYNVQCLLPVDVKSYHRADPKLKPGFIVPVPRKLNCKMSDDAPPEHRQLPSYLGVAKAGHYHPAVGYLDNPLVEWRQK
jgi:hypothetical protein